jgi:hypothetical protein
MCLVVVSLEGGEAFDITRCPTFPCIGTIFIVIITVFLRQNLHATVSTATVASLVVIRKPY